MREGGSKRKEVGKEGEGEEWGVSRERVKRWLLNQSNMGM